MKIALLSLALVAIVLVILAVLRFTRARALPNTLEAKLDKLAQCGLRLAEPFRAHDLLESWDRAQFEKPGYNLVLVGLGMTEEREPWRNHCINLWHFDTECIEDHGAYKRIADRMVEMAAGSLPLEDIRDYVDVENETAWLSFVFNGHQTKIDCRVDVDWVDEHIFGTFVDCLSRSDPSKMYIYYDLGGQDCVIGCVSKDQYRCLNDLGIAFKPLT